jgi:branched-chain amino acid transport system ATP-binding protein
MGLAEHADKMAADLSSGQQRMVEITRAIAAHARLLLLDEPAVGLSTSERDHLMTVLRDLASEGIAILFIEHLIDLVMAVSDRIVVLNYGEVIAEDTPEKIRSHEAVLEAYLGHT